METPSGATTETTSATTDVSAANSQGAESPPAAEGASEKGRIDELTGNWRETQRDRDFWKNRALELEGKGKQNNGAQANGSGEERSGEGNDDVDDEDVKTLADFKYDEKAYGKYIRDLARAESKREADAVRNEIKGERTEAEKVAALTEFQDKAVTWAKGQNLENPEVMFKSPAEGGPAISGEMAEAIQTSEHGPALLNYLARNVAESKRIYKLPPLQQARELGRLEAKFAAAPAQSTASGAPPPPPQVKGASDTSVTKDPAKMSDSEWYAEQQRSERARRNAAGGKK